MVQCAAYRRFCRNQPGFQADVSNNGRRSNLAAWMREVSTSRDEQIQSAVIEYIAPQAVFSRNLKRLPTTKPILGWRHLRMVVDEFSPGIKKSGNLEMRYCS